MKPLSPGDAEKARHFGDVVRRFREDSRMGPTALGAATGLTRQTIHNHEKGLRWPIDSKSIYAYIKHFGPAFDAALRGEAPSVTAGAPAGDEVGLLLTFFRKLTPDQQATVLGHAVRLASKG